MKLLTLRVSEDGQVDVASSSESSRQSDSQSSSSRSSSSDDTFKSIDENIDEQSKVDQPRKFVQNYPSFNIEFVDEDDDEQNSNNQEFEEDN